MAGDCETNWVGPFVVRVCAGGLGKLAHSDAVVLEFQLYRVRPTATSCSVSSQTVSATEVFTVLTVLGWLGCPYVGLALVSVVIEASRDW